MKNKNVNKGQKVVSKRMNSESLEGVVFMPIFIVIFAVILFFVAKPLIPYTRDNTTAKTFTLQSVNLDNGYEIKVAEEELPLKIKSVESHGVDDDAIKGLAVGEQITCYVINGDKHFKYFIVEISQGDKYALTLDDANAAREENRQTGIILCSVIIGACVLGFIPSVATLHRTSASNNRWLTNLFLKRRLKKDGMSKEQIADYMRELREQDSLILPCTREELEANITQSITYDNGKYYTTVSDHLKNEGCKIVFYEMLFDKLADGELLILQDVIVSKEENVESIYVAYKYRNNLMLDYLTENEETHRFDMLDFLGCWNYPTSKRMKAKEVQAFREALREYDRLHDDVFDIPC